MKLSVVLLAIAALPAASAGTRLHLRGPPQPRAIGVSSGGDFSLGVNASFVLNTGDDLTAEEQIFAKYSIRRAYNSVHDPNTLVMKFAELIDEEKSPMPEEANRDSMSLWGKYQPYSWVLGVATVGTCRLCRSVIDGRLTDSSWELAFCGELRQGPFAAFQDVSNCTIAIFLPETGENDDVEDVQLAVTSYFTVPYNADLTTNEQLFANECLRLSYNEVHDPATVFMGKIDLTNQTYHGAQIHAEGDVPLKAAVASDELKQSFSWALEWLAETSFRSVDAHDDDNSNSFLRVSASASLKLNEQHHNRWQIAFCDKMRSGPFEAFQSIANCQILVGDGALSSVARGKTASKH